MKGLKMAKRVSVSKEALEKLIEYADGERQAAHEAYKVSTSEEGYAASAREFEELVNALDAKETEIMYLYHYRFVGGEEFALYRNREDAEARCEGHRWAEVISLIVL
jgi:hypothetical protein